MNNEAKVLDIFVEDIIPNRFQPRLAFDDSKIEELANSIKIHGIIQPLVLRQVADKYEIIAGERRYKAAIMAGLQKVPAIVNNLDDNQSAEVALVENIQRRDLSAIEEAKSFKKLLDRGYLTQDQLAAKMGISQSTMSNKMRLLNLDESVQKALLEEKISERHARSMLAVDDFEKQKELLNLVIANRLTVRQLDEEIKNMINTPSINNNEMERLDLPIFDQPSTMIDTPPIENSNIFIEPANVLPSIDQNNYDASLNLPILKSQPTESFVENKDEKKLSNLIDLSQITSGQPSMFFPVNENNSENIIETVKTPSLEELIIEKPIEFEQIVPNNNEMPNLIVDNPAESLKPIEGFSPSPEKEKQELNSYQQETIIKIDKTNFRTVEQAFESIKKQIESEGFKIEMDTYSFDEYYQLIIKIYK